jgi:hypothetical protein
MPDEISGMSKANGNTCLICKNISVTVLDIKKKYVKVRTIEIARPAKKSPFKHYINIIA